MGDIKGKLKNLPRQPGVYLMKDPQKNIIYVGKSKCLKNRVSQYFHSNQPNLKVQAMVDNIADFEYIVTDTEMEALVLECNLIKKHKPYYNILLKDGKQYPYIKITTSEDFPRILLARKQEKDKNQYFGPYTGGMVRETMDVLRKVFKIRTCKRVLPRDIGKERPCLNYHIGLCSAPCQGSISKEEYRQAFDEIKDFLDGRGDTLVQDLKEQMKAYSDALEFEKAAMVRDKIQKLEGLWDSQKIVSTKGEDQDVIAVSTHGWVADIQIFVIRGGKITGREQILLERVIEETKNAILGQVMSQYYAGMGDEALPRQVLVNTLPEDSALLEAFLTDKKGVKVTIRRPQRGEKLELVKMAEKNAQQVIDDYNARATEDRARNRAAVKELEDTLGIAIKRVEAYDISNTAGTNSVGSMCVFEDGMPANSEYRHFKIKTIDGSDDYGSLQEVLSRRLQRALQEREKGENKGFARLPDVIFADGGLGQAHVIEGAVQAAGLDIPVYGMVKDDSHRTRALISCDGEIIPLSREAFRWVALIQEEVHRIAIRYHRKTREKSSIRSELEEIPGIGKTRRKNLIKAFGSVKKMREASLEELANVPGVGRSAAENVFQFLHGNDG